MSDAGSYLRGIARRHAALYIAHTSPMAILLTGSGATGEVDGYADVDLICYYEAMPPEPQFLAAREHGGDATVARHDAWNEAAIGEQWAVGGLEVQVGHFLAASTERDIAAATEAFSTDAVLHKQLLGLAQGVPLHGENIIARWQALLADYPDGLARALVERHLRDIFPAWYYAEHMARRDATLWLRQVLAEAALHLLGVLAGLNRRYYSPLQLKRTRDLAAALPIAPADVIARLEIALSSAPTTAIEQMEAIVDEVLALVERHMPEADTAALLHRPGTREQPWAVPPR